MLKSALVIMLTALLGSAIALTAALPAGAAQVEAQPLIAQVRRVAQALEFAGAPLDAERAAALEAACAEPDGALAIAGIQRALDPLCLAAVSINPESRVKAERGAAPAELMQQGWRVFLVKIDNQAGVTAPLRVTSPNAEAPFAHSGGLAEPDVEVSAAQVRDRWLDLHLEEGRPLVPRLSGLALEYRLLALYGRDAGLREAKLAFDVGQGTQELGFRGELDVLFKILPARAVKLIVLDADGKPTTGQFEFRDAAGRILPATMRRSLPDFFFQSQVYRASGESVLLPPGEIRARWTRGPEYLSQERAFTVLESGAQEETFQLVRWIDLAAEGWHSGDHHVHAAGCAHFDSPTQGTGPEAMLRHALGEDLRVACVLSWGPCWYYQKQFFEGGTSALSTAENLLRYDVEVSGFPSSHAGHVCLLRLTEDDYPGTTRIEEWPTWDLPVLQWAKSQGAVVGFAHSGFGLEVADAPVPSHEMPRFDGIGANEYVVDVAHGAVDFISTVDTPPAWELSIWYHTLNCGYRTRIGGETDFPCLTGERVGMGRSYVALPAGQPLTYDAWVLGLRDGRSYVSDGKSHLLDFRIGALAVGTAQEGRPASLLEAQRGAALTVRARAAALLEPDPREDIRGLPADQQPFWHVERARIGETREVPVELIVNGAVAATRNLVADGRIVDLSFELELDRSSWVALRIYPSSHTNPVFVQVDGAPIRASRRSAKWCEQAVGVCWESKRAAIRASELEAARAAYDAAAAAYRRIAGECAAD